MIITANLRWIVPNGTSTEQGLLQYRDVLSDERLGGRGPHKRPWVTVPCVGVSLEEFEAAKRGKTTTMEGGE